MHPLLRRFMVTAMLLMAGCSPCLAEQNPKPSQKLPAPDAAAVEEARTLVTQAFADAYKTAKDTPHSLIKQLLDAESQTTDSVRKYAMLLEAEEAAMRSGDYGWTMQLMDRRASTFDIDGLQMRVALLETLALQKTKADPQSLVKLFACACDTAERCRDVESLTQARAAAEVAKRIATQIVKAARNNRSLAKEGVAKQNIASDLIKDLDEDESASRQYAEAVEALSFNPSDPAANGVVGRHLCFRRDNWAQGLPALAKGDQQKMADAAAIELKAFASDKPNAKAVFELAGKWWAVAESKDLKVSTAREIRQHSSSLYRSIWKSLEDPVDKAIAQKRMHQDEENRPGDHNATKVAGFDQAQTFRIVPASKPDQCLAPVGGGVGLVSIQQSDDSSVFKIVPGLADPRSFSLESVTRPDHYVRHQSFRVKVNGFLPDDTFKKDATFWIIRGTDDRVLFKSFNFPNRHIRYRKDELWIDEGSDQLYYQEAAFKLVPATAPSK